MNIITKIYRKFKYHFLNNKIARTYEKEQDMKNDLKKKYQYVIDTFEHQDFQKEFSDKVWICWLQGLDEAPLLVKKCVESIKKAMPNKEIIILTKDNYKKYTNFPDYIIEKYEKGIITHTHLTDLMRINLLINHGGLWLDSTVFCTSTEEPTYITKEPLFVFKEITLKGVEFQPIKASSWLISACKHHPILEATQKILFEYWKHNDKLVYYYLFHLSFAIACEEYQDLFDAIPSYNNISPHILYFELNQEFNAERFEQIKKISDIHKLNRKLEYKQGHFTNYDYVLGKKQNGKN